MKPGSKFLILFQGMRKYGCVLINQGDKLTKEEKEDLKLKNAAKYGLSQEYINYLKIPEACNVKVYQTHKILHARKKLTTCEKIEHMLDIQEALTKKLNCIQKGEIIKDFDYLTPQQYTEKYGYFTPKKYNKTAKIDSEGVKV